jgi:death-on-curing protein
VSDPEYLSLEDAVSLLRALRVGPIRDVGLLDSALARPRSSAFGDDAYQSIELKAAALLHSLVKNHPLVDGNKRLGWLSATVFLRLNGHRPTLSHDDAFGLVVNIAGGDLALSDIARRLAVEVDVAAPRRD